MGLMDVVEQEGAEFFDHNRPPFQEVGLSYAGTPEVGYGQPTRVLGTRP